MSSIAALQDRLDRVVNTRLSREEQELEAQAAADRIEARVQARADAHRCREISELFDPAFQSHNQQTPPSIDGEPPRQYRRRLYDRLRLKLPPNHELADIRSDDAGSGQAYVNFERQMIDAAVREGEHPSSSNLPPDGSMISRVQTDDMGEKSIRWFGRESFIKELSRPGRRVERFVHPNMGVIFGRPFDQR
jgi:hypothetical protein